jgi:hypothetical protein
MRRSGRRLRHTFAVSAMAVAATALMVAGVTSAAVGAQSNPHAGAATGGPGYPPPGGIYKPFTNCPLLNPLMQESVGNDATGCVAGNVSSGSIKIGNIVTPVVRAVHVQFGIWDPPNATAGGDNPAGGQFAGGILPPPVGGMSAMLATKPDLIPQSLTTALGCPSTNKVVERLCQKAQSLGGKSNEVFALAQSAGQLTNFQLTAWTQRVKFKLINPLLGNNCYIGSDNNPVVLNPQLSLGPGGKLVELADPNPAKHPNTVVLKITKAIASDTTFAAPGVTGCGPGGAANRLVDKALDTSAALPAASGVNSLTLNGVFSIAVCFNSKNQAKILLSAFKDSATSALSGHQQPARQIPFANLHHPHMLGLK